MKRSRSRRALIVGAVLVLALGLRIGEIARSPYRPINDPKSYLVLARQVAHSGDYSTSTKPGTGSNGSRGPTALFPPAFPYFLAAVDLIAGHTGALGPMVTPARISQAVLGTIAVALIGLVALESFGEPVALAALVLGAVYPVLIETSSIPLAENLLIVFELAAVYCALRLRRAGAQLSWLILAGGFTGLAALTHQNGLLLIIPVAIAGWSSAASRGLRMRALAVIAASCVLTLAPWTVRNAVLLHSFVPISDQAGETLLGTYNADSGADRRLPYRWLYPTAITTARALVRDAPRLTEPDWEGRLLSRAVNYIGDHPSSPFAVAFHNTLRLLDLGGSFAWKAAAGSIGLQQGTAEIGVVSFWIVAMLALLGTLSVYARRAPLWMWLVPILLALATVFVRAETPRFREPIEPFLIMLAGCALASVATRTSPLSAWSRRSSATAPPSQRRAAPAPPTGGD